MEEDYKQSAAYKYQLEILKELNGTIDRTLEPTAEARKQYELRRTPSPSKLLAEFEKRVPTQVH